MSFACGVAQNLLGTGVWVEWFALFDADHRKLVDHDSIPFVPRLSLHEAVERLKEAQVVWNRAVEHGVDRIDELCRWRIGCL
jgi:hypothetical protein